MGKKLEIIVNIAFYAIIISIVYIILNFLLPVLIPFLIAFVIAAIVRIPMKWLPLKKKSGEKLYIVGMVIAFYVLLFSGMIFLGSKALSVGGTLITEVPQFYAEKILPSLDDVTDNISEKLLGLDIEIVKSVEETIQEFFYKMGQSVTDLSVSAVKNISNVLTMLPSIIVTFIVTIVATFFIAIDYERIKKFVKNLFLKEHQDNYEKIKAYVLEIIVVYIKSYSLILAITFVELSIGFLILRLPYAILLALIIAVFDILPLVGTGGILIPWATVMGFLGNYKMLIGLLLIYLVITVIRNIIEPRIIGRQIGVHPLATLILMFIGLKLFGLLGMIILPITASVLINIWKNKVIEFMAEHKQEV